nr:MAG TPA: hypothetical protein [Caudoviricetes sp.]
MGEGGIDRAVLAGGPIILFAETAGAVNGNNA